MDGDDGSVGGGGVGDRPAERVAGERPIRQPDDDRGVVVERALAHDGQRARRLSDQVVARGGVHEVAQPVVVVGADDDEVGIVAGGEEGDVEGIGRQTVADIVVVADGVGDEPNDVGAGRVVLPAEEAGDGEAVAGAVIDGPAQRGGRSGRAVEADDDAVHGSMVRLAGIGGRAEGPVANGAGVRGIRGGGRRGGGDRGGRGGRWRSAPSPARGSSGRGARRRRTR